MILVVGYYALYMYGQGASLAFIATTIVGLTAAFCTLGGWLFLCLYFASRKQQ